MCQPLPAGGFSWIMNNLDAWAADKIHELFKHGRKGHLLEVHVDCPHHLHDLHNDLPFLPEIIDGNLLQILTISVIT